MHIHAQRMVEMAYITARVPRTTRKRLDNYCAGNIGDSKTTQTHQSVIGLAIEEFLKKHGA